MSGNDAVVIIATKLSLGEFEGFWAEENAFSLKNLILKEWDYLRQSKKDLTFTVIHVGVKDGGLTVLPQRKGFPSLVSSPVYHCSQ